MLGPRRPGQRPPSPRRESGRRTLRRRRLAGSSGRPPARGAPSSPRWRQHRAGPGSAPALLRHGLVPILRSGAGPCPRGLTRARDSGRPEGTEGCHALLRARGLYHRPVHSRVPRDEAHALRPTGRGGAECGRRVASRLAGRAVAGCRSTSGVVAKPPRRRRPRPGRRRRAAARRRRHLRRHRAFRPRSRSCGAHGDQAMSFPNPIEGVQSLPPALPWRDEASAEASPSPVIRPSGFRSSPGSGPAWWSRR